MTSFNETVTHERLRALLHYDPETGIFTWRTWGLNGPAGCINCGYRQIMVDGLPYYAHRLAWLYVYGEWPAGNLDHINRERADNRIENLRLATRSQNMANSLGRAASGFKGVYRNKGEKKWQAKIRINNRNQYLGVFDTPKEAHVAYCRAAAEHFGTFTCTEHRED